jgi:hypothetical protein
MVNVMDRDRAFIFELKTKSAQESDTVHCFCLTLTFSLQTIRRTKRYEEMERTHMVSWPETMALVNTLRYIIDSATDSHYLSGIVFQIISRY